MLSPAKWHYRLPFYGKVIASDVALARFDNQAVMDAEIQSAAGALDYWAFFEEEPNTPKFTALKLYLASALSHKVGFTVVCGPGCLNGIGVQQQLAYFRHLSYVLLPDGRPLVYIFLRLLHDDDHLPAIARQLRAVLGNLTSLSISQGTGAPYYVAMHPDPKVAAHISTMAGLNSLSTYSWRPVATVGENVTIRYPYSRLTAAVESRWDEYAAVVNGTGIGVVPCAMTGWDGRPRQERPDINPAFKTAYHDSYVNGSPNAVARHVMQAARWCQRHPRLAPGNAVLIYAWNEFSEGGHLCPRLSDGDDRLRAIREVRSTSAFDEI